MILLDSHAAVIWLEANGYMTTQTEVVSAFLPCHLTRRGAPETQLMFARTCDNTTNCNGLRSTTCGRVAERHVGATVTTNGRDSGVPSAENEAAVNCLSVPNRWSLGASYMGSPTGSRSSLANDTPASTVRLDAYGSSIRRAR